MKPYHIEKDDSDVWGYQTLVGPNGFICTLTEPEDRVWLRDLSVVMNRLNELEAKLAAAKSVMWMAREYALSNSLRPTMGVPDPITEFQDAKKIVES